MSFISNFKQVIENQISEEVNKNWNTLKYAEDTIALIGPYEVYMDMNKVIWASNAVDKKEVECPSEAAKFIASCIIADITYV